MRSEKKKERQRASTRQLIGITAIMKDGVRTAQGELVFFLLKPTNIAVLSDANITARVMALADVLKGFPDLEMLCLNSREDFEGNKRYLVKRIAEEHVPEIRALLEQDLAWLDTVQSQMATSREFALVLRLPLEKEGTDKQSKTASQPAPQAKMLYRAGDGQSPGTRPALAPVQPRPGRRAAKASLTLARLEKALKGRGFIVRLAGSQEIMRLLAVYFAQNVTTEHFEDYDGQRFGLEQPV